jgi:phage shock protein A
MFEDLRAAFREALDNFNKELSRDHVPENVDKLLYGMKEEIAEEKAAVSGLEAQLDKARGQIEQLRQNLATARRREEMARKIEDEETVKLAEEFAVKYQSHLTVLDKKVAALEEERDFRQKTVDEMIARFQEAREKRDALGATAGRSGARQTLSAADDLFGELDRMAEKIEGERARGEAAEAFDDLDLEPDEGSEYRIDLDEQPRREELDVDAALAELKRRMGESG